ncbi:MAG TPA: TylF/MycF/NovP-related O-methyltransferase [Elusimicrobiales bacterium]|nr:TylF/MycF/NovP-related O-methyltransferase [Elusimicrobiales bacterium]
MKTSISPATKKEIAVLGANPHRLAVLRLIYSDKKRAAALVRRVKRETELLLDDSEANQLLTLVRDTHKIKGDIAEAGVYKGGSAKLICEAKKGKKLYLFDTFNGLPAPGRFSRGLLKAGALKASFEKVKEYLKGYPGVYIFKGEFPRGSAAVAGKAFSLVHLDVDTYEGTLSCLKFFYPRLARGGVLLAHDYLCLAGVKKAFGFFFRNKPEAVIELPGTQCMLVKL